MFPISMTPISMTSFSKQLVFVIHNHHLMSISRIMGERLSSVVINNDSNTMEHPITMKHGVLNLAF